MSELHLALAANRAYLPWCATTIASALAATRASTVTVHVVLDRDVGSAQEKLLIGMVERSGGTADLHRLDPERLGALPSGASMHGGAISSARMLLPELLPAVRRLVYLDCDILVLADLADLAAQLPDDAPVAAVRNVNDDAVTGHARSLGLSGDRYFNSGVLVMNLELMRERRSTPEMIGVLHDRGEALILVDQDVYNIVFADSWFEVGPRWNVQNSFTAWRALADETFGRARVDAALADPGIVHFEGPQTAKPWHQLATGEHSDHYRRVLATTPWAGTPWLAASPLTRLLVRLPARSRLKAYGALRRLGHP